MANNIVKELNEIKDNYDTEIKDGKNMVEALDGIREAIEQDGEYTSSKNVANAVKDLGVALKEHNVEWRNFTYIQMPYEEVYYDNGNFFPYYNENNELVMGIMGESSVGGNPPTTFSGKLPVINGKCEIVWSDLAIGDLDETSVGCTIEAVGEVGVKLSITEDNAVIKNIYNV